MSRAPSLTIEDIQLLLEALDMLDADHCQYSENPKLHAEIEALNNKLHKIWALRSK